MVLVSTETDSLSCVKPALRGVDVVEAFDKFITYKLDECLAFFAMYIFYM